MSCSIMFRRERYIIDIFSIMSYFHAHLSWAWKNVLQLQGVQSYLFISRLFLEWVKLEELTLLHSEWHKLNRVLAILRAIGLRDYHPNLSIIAAYTGKTLKLPRPSNSEAFTKYFSMRNYPCFIPISTPFLILCLSQMIKTVIMTHLLYGEVTLTCLYLPPIACGPTLTGRV